VIIQKMVHFIQLLLEFLDLIDKTCNIECRFGILVPLLTCTSLPPYCSTVRW